MNIICDLDGTLANDKARTARHLHQPCTEGCVPPLPTDALYRDLCCGVCGGRGKFHRWKEYFDECDTDTLNEAVFAIVNSFAMDHDIVIISGRDNAVREKTEKWLSDHGVCYQQLHLRGETDRTDDNILKIQKAKELGLTPENVLFILEDRQRVVDAWRAAGFTCFQVAPGQF